MKIEIFWRLPNEGQFVSVSMFLLTSGIIPCIAIEISLVTRNIINEVRGRLGVQVLSASKSLPEPSFAHSDKPYVNGMAQGLDPVCKLTKDTASWTKSVVFKCSNNSGGWQRWTNVVDIEGSFTTNVYVHPKLYRW